MKKILVVFGTRPEAIKMAPVIQKLNSNSGLFDIRICVTAQHRQMLDQVLRVFDIRPDFDLDIMKKDQDLFDVTTNVMLKINAVFDDYKPDVVLVHGDTTTAFATSLAAFYKMVPVGHVEAGLRTNDIYSPWPEEINRQLISRIAKYHFAPTSLNKDNLIKENIREDLIIVTGNTVIDTLFMVIDKIKADSRLENKLIKHIQDMGYCFSNRKFILVTGHRRENFGQGFLNICKALKEIAQSFSNYDIVYPVHLNPNVRKPVCEILGGNQNIFIIEPLEYDSFIYLMYKSHLILTDSGGIQEEAPSLGKPVLVMRNTTERPEALITGTIKLVGTDVQKIVQETEILLNDSVEYNKMATAHNPYGDGKAADRIVDFLVTSQDTAI